MHVEAKAASILSGKFERIIDFDEESKLNDAHDSLNVLIELLCANIPTVIDIHQLAVLLGLINDRLGSVVIGYQDGVPSRLAGIPSRESGIDNA